MVKILVIDDSSFQRKIIGSILKEGGYELATAENGKNAIENLSITAPDLIISDLLMPEFDGFYLLEKMKAGNVSIPILIVTSDIQKPTREKCYQMGARGLINKPVFKEALLPAVKKILAGEKV
jgi:two-component system, chemotaxis family, chemotaxis protein CheY